MTKFLVVALIAVCALTASLYATAAPKKQGPTNAQLAAQIASLRSQVKTMKADVSWLAGGIKTLDACQMRQLWTYEQLTFSLVGQLYFDSPKVLTREMFSGYAPKRPDCG
jgi:hypothetical protein